MVALKYPKPIREKRERKPLRRTWLRRKSYTRHWLKRDAEATARAAFENRHSFMDVFGNEWRHGKDREVWHDLVAANDSYACRLCHTFVGLFGEADHIIPLGKGGDWKLMNGQWLCRPCHEAKHPEKNKLHWSRKVAGQ